MSVEKNINGKSIASGTLEFAKDITNTREREAVFSIQNEALKELAQGGPLKNVADILTDGLEKIYDEARCSILLFNSSEQTLESCSAPGLPEEFSKAINGMKIGPEVGSCGTAVYRKEMVIVEDISTDSLWGRARKFALSHGLRACWSFPIFSSSRDVLGTFAVYYNYARKPGAGELNVIQELAYIAGVAIERKETENALLESENRYRSILNHAADPCFIIDAEGKFIDVNQKACESLGYEREELLKISGKDIGIGLDGSAFSGIEKDPHGESTLILEGEHRRKDGSLVPVEVNIGRIRIRNSHYFMAAVRDMTERKIAEEKLRNYANELEKSNKNLEDFAYIASHDLREPLRKIMIFGDRLKEKSPELGEEARDYLKRMQDSADRMQDFILDLLEYSRVKTRSKSIRPVNLNQVIKSALEDLEELAQESKAEIIVDPMPKIEADFNQMQILFQNLVSNAIKFKRPGVTPLVKIKSFASDESGSWKISVEDNGVGFEYEIYR